MEKKKVSQLNDLFEKMLSNKLGIKESVELSHLYNEFIEEDRSNIKLKSSSQYTESYNR